MDQPAIKHSSSASKPSNKNGTFAWPEAAALKQNFSFPDTTIYYITKNPSTPEVYLKMIQCCKYFFEKHPIIVAARIHNGGRKLCSKREYQCDLKHYKCCTNLDIAKLSCKIWLTNKLDFTLTDIPNFSSYLMPKIYRCEEAEFHFRHQTIIMKDFQLFASKFQKFDLCGISIIKDDGRVALFEEMLESIKNVKEFSYYFYRGVYSATDSSMKNILQLQNLDNLQKFVLRNIPSVFDINDFDEFIETHENTKFWLNFGYHISAEQRNKLDKITDKVIAFKRSNCVLLYAGQNQEKLEIMHHCYIS